MDTNKNISKEHALSVLDDLRNINERAKTECRSPIWVNVLAVICFTLYVFANYMREISEFWYPVEIPFLLALLLSIFLQYYLVVKSGVKPRMFPTTTKGRLIWPGRVALLIAISFSGPRITNEGYPIATYVLATLTAVLASWFVYKYPSVDVIDADTQ